MIMTRPYQITGVLALLIAGFLFWESLRLRYYTPLGPGPGFFPFWLSIFLAFLAAAMIYQATCGKPEPKPADFYPDRRGVLRLGAVLGTLAAVIALIEPVGFRLAMCGFYVVLFTALGRQHPVLTGSIALAGSFGVYYVFVHWLGTPLPVGLFGI
jgi:putative tricarboxylic transport membrane protein